MSGVIDLPPSDERVWHGRTFRDLGDLIGGTQARDIAERFAVDLARRFAEPQDREATRRDAHVIVSSAGMLGFAALSTEAASLESACQDGSYGHRVTALIAERDAALRSLDRWLGSARTV